MTKKSVLIVDDEALLLEVWRDFFNSMDFVHLFEAECGEDAVAIVKEQELDLIITDLRMPRGDGFVLLDFLKSKYQKTIPTYVCSGYYDEEKNKLENYNIVELVEKPFDLIQTFSKVKKYLE